MSKKGRPTLDKKDKRFETRVSEKTLMMLEECAQKLNTTRTGVILRGIELVKKELDE